MYISLLNIIVLEAEEIEEEIVEEAVEEAADKVETADELLDAAEQEAVEAVAIAESAGDYIITLEKVYNIQSLKSKIFKRNLFFLSYICNCPCLTIQSILFLDDAEDIPVAEMDNLAAEAVMMHSGDYGYGGDYEGEIEQSETTHVKTLLQIYY